MVIRTRWRQIGRQPAVYIRGNDVAQRGQRAFPVGLVVGSFARPVQVKRGGGPTLVVSPRSEGRGWRGARGWQRTSSMKVHTASLPARWIPKPVEVQNLGTTDRNDLMIPEVLQDVRQAIRSAAVAPWTTVVVLLTMAIGVGANSAIFSVINGVVLRPLPYPEPRHRREDCGELLAVALVEERGEHVKGVSGDLPECVGGHGVLQ
jgi:hypothetical protein